ncbi:MAG: CDP-alcohol phosphatidyltransferase family protein [Mariprofundaceae bacterium]|nr:CDP-alcohol phosphatidyltransferase family protein [Mariprofundaceae bacterium]
MASIYDLKASFQKLLRPLVGHLAKSGITANQVTVFAMFISMLGGAFIVMVPAESWPLLLVPLVLFVRMALNAIDGMLAREHNMQSPLGGFLNEIGDVVSDIFLYLPFALLIHVSSILVLTTVLLAMISEMVGVISVQVGASRRYDGPMGKSDRAFVFGSIALTLGLGIPAGLWLNILLSIVVLLLLITINNRMQKALMELQ